MTRSFSQADLEAFLDEGLPPDQMAHIEAALRGDEHLRRELAGLNSRRDAGVHSLGEIWRRHRLSCPSREQLGSYLLGALPTAMAGYVRLHLETVGCRRCQANLADLDNQRAEAAEIADSRRRKYFQSSAGYLRGK